MDAWMRVLTVNLTSTKLKKQFTFGGNYSKKKEDLAIKATINKYMSPLKDEAIVEISNLTQSEITQIIMGEFYDVDIYCGYRGQNIQKVFSGGVFYISNKLEQDRTNTCILICTSKLVAKYGQKRMNLTLNSGINLYSAIKFICRRAGIPDSNVSTQLKKDFLTEVMAVNDSAASWLDLLCQSNNQLIPNSDSIINQTFSIFDATKSNNRCIKLNPENIIMSGGPPRLTDTGVNFTILPTFAFMCGDTIQIDNSLLNVYAESRTEAAKNIGAYFSKSGQYMIFQMEYKLQNRGPAFTLKLLCKSRDRISNYVGGVK